MPQPEAGAGAGAAQRSEVTCNSRRTRDSDLMNMSLALSTPRVDVATFHFMITVLLLFPQFFHTLDLLSLHSTHTQIKRLQYLPSSTSIENRYDGLPRYFRGLCDLGHEEVV
jgi:hypothetical protein